MNAAKMLILLLPIVFLSCSSGDSNSKIKTAQEYKVLMTKLLLSGDEMLLEAAPLVDDDVASMAHYTYADSLFGIVKIESDSNDFEQSLAKMYTGSAHIFFGMAYKATLLTHAEFPIMNFFGVRNARMEKLDAAFDQYLHDKSPMIILQLKNGWIHAMVDFYKVQQHPLYDQMKVDFEEYIKLNDSIMAAYNQEDAVKIMMLESERQLFRQLMYITIGTFDNNSDKTSLIQFYEEGNKMAAVYDNIPMNTNSLLVLSELKYYSYFYHSGVVVYNLLRQISINLSDSK